MKKSNSGSESELVDLEEIVRDFAEGYLTSSQRRKADLNTPVINWDKMFVTYGETKYDSPLAPTLPGSHVLFSANFSNDTPKEQTYALRTERSTKSSCTISFSKTFSFGINISLKLTPPNPMVEANSGFRSDMSKTQGQTQSFERALTWSVDNNVSVPSGYETRAELVIKEDDFNRDFSVPCTFEGTVSVTYESKKGRKLVTTVRDHVKNIFAKQPGFSLDDAGKPLFVVTGKCMCRFGVEQSVRLTEMPLSQGQGSGSGAQGGRGGGEVS